MRCSRFNQLRSNFNAGFARAEFNFQNFQWPLIEREMAKETATVRIQKLIDFFRIHFALRRQSLVVRAYNIDCDGTLFVLKQMVKFGQGTVVDQCDIPRLALWKHGHLIE